MALLRMVGDGDGRTFDLDSPFSIGRSAGNSLVLADDGEVSREHAVVTPSGTAYTLTDLGSSNGTRVLRDGRNWQVSPEIALLDGDIIHIGGTQLQFEAGAATQVGMSLGEQTVVGRVIPPR